ncbi:MULTISPECIES: DUF4358 domain-containing protein [Anaerotruncus]|uniref:DUF4358 domain-containing protein n=1 Tax=Anaerotruncus TaxID=244127 RepID=UPI001553E687|nr:DUF4358 domain-containing protein [Anaerotruncus massiliensis (ex Togo et al. 2019)]
MKKIFAVLLSAALFAGMLTGCGSKPAASGDSTEMKEGQTIQTVVDQIIDEVGIAMPAEIDDTLMKDVFYIDPEKDVDEYYGQFAMVNVSADNLLAVKAKPEQKDAVIEAMGKRLKDVQASFSNYLPDQSEKAQKGRVVDRGNYVFLVILGESPETFDDDLDRAVKIIDEAFAA